MNLVDGNVYWTAKNGIMYQYPYLKEDIECDIAIIGGGITGALCAYYLTEANVKSVVLEKNVIGFGSTSASTSLLDYEVDYDLIELEKKIGLFEALKSYQLCKKALDDLEEVVNQLDDRCEFQRRDILYFTDTKGDVDALWKEFELRNNNGYAVQWLDANAAPEYFSFPIEAGILTRNTAGEVDPYRLTHVLIQKALQKGLQVYENTEVIDLRFLPNEVLITTNYEQRVKAKKVLIATGYEIKNFLKDNLVTLNRTYTVVTNPIQADFPGWYNRSLIRDTRTVYTYLRTTADNRIIIGGGDTPYGNTLNLEILAEQRHKMLLNRLTTMFPQFEGLEAEYKFTGLFGETKDGLPYLGAHPDIPNCYFCLGYGSNGILYAILGAQLIRDLHFGNPWSDASLFAFKRFQRIPIGV